MNKALSCMFNPGFKVSFILLPPTLVLLMLPRFEDAAACFLEVFLVSALALDPLSGHRAVVSGVIPSHGRSTDCSLHCAFTGISAKLETIEQGQRFDDVPLVATHGAPVDVSWHNSEE